MTPSWSICQPAVGPLEGLARPCLGGGLAVAATVGARRADLRSLPPAALLGPLQFPRGPRSLSTLFLLLLLQLFALPGMVSPFSPPWLPDCPPALKVGTHFSRKASLALPCCIWAAPCSLSPGFLRGHGVCGPSHPPIGELLAGEDSVHASLWGMLHWDMQ